MPNIRWAITFVSRLTLRVLPPNSSLSRALLRSAVVRRGQTRLAPSSSERARAHGSTQPGGRRAGRIVWPESGVKADPRFAYNCALCSLFLGFLMPIYAYRCSACGFENDHLQKLSDPVLTSCPTCGQASYHKRVTAAGFQLKGSGWYVTDFKGGNDKAPAASETPAQATPASSTNAPAPASTTGSAACADS